MSILLLSEAENARHIAGIREMAAVARQALDVVQGDGPPAYAAAFRRLSASAKQRLMAAKSAAFASVRDADESFQSALERVLAQNAFDTDYFLARDALERAWAEFRVEFNAACEELGIPEAFPASGAVQ